MTDVPPEVATGSWAIDPARTGITFSVGTRGMGTVRGRVDLVSGTSRDGQVEVVIDATSLSTGNPLRDAHLRGSDFLHTRRFPTMTFASTSVSSMDPATLCVTGNLTIHNRTHPIVLDVTWTLVDDGELGFSSGVTLDRSQFGISPGPLNFGMLIKRNVNVEIRGVARPVPLTKSSRGARDTQDNHHVSILRTV